MSKAARPNPVELFEKVSSWVKEVIAGVQQDQLDAHTPCSEWNVRLLLNHLIGGAELLSGSLLGRPPKIGVGEANSSYAAEGDAGKLSQAYDVEVEKVLRAAQEPGALERKLSTPLGEMAAGDFMDGTLMDHLIHGWDLAKATGQDTSLDADLVEFSYMALVPDMADKGRAAGVFGPVVHVPDDASMQDRLLGYMGRRP